MIDQARPEEARRGTRAPIEWAVLKLAEHWHLHPADVDPRLQRPRRAQWFYYALEMYDLESSLAAKPSSGSVRPPEPHPAPPAAS